MKEYYSKRNPKSVIRNMILIELIFSAFLYLTYKDLSIIPIEIWISWFIILILVIYSVVKAIKNKPTLIVDSLGIVDNYALQNSIGKIEWNEISNVEIRNDYKMRFLCIDFVDEEKILNRANLFKRLLMKSNKKKLKTICAIPEISLNESLETIVTEINKHRLEIKA